MWYALDITLAARAREAVEYALMEAGALGTEVVAEDAEEARVAAYFDAPPEVEAVRAALMEAVRIYGLASSDVREMRLREVADADWLAEWKKGWRATEVGERFVVAPPWSEVEGGAGRERIVIRIEPGMAFGTGTHETTRLCLALVEKHFRGESFLDVGTGTGILAIAAAKLFPGARVEACDTDPLAVEVARENAALNGVAEVIDFRVGSVGEVDGGAFDGRSSPRAETVCANLTADVIVPLLPSLLAAAREKLILSGILETQAEAVRARLRELGVDSCGVVRDGEWVALAVVLPSGPGPSDDGGPRAMETIILPPERLSGGPTVHLVYLRSGGMVVTKKPYSGWREIQDEYEDYMTSLGPWTEEELSEFLREEYEVGGHGGPGRRFTRERIRAFFDSAETALAVE